MRQRGHSRICSASEKKHKVVIKTSQRFTVGALTHTVIPDEGVPPLTAAKRGNGRHARIMTHKRGQYMDFHLNTH